MFGPAEAALPATSSGAPASVVGGRGVEAGVMRLSSQEKAPMILVSAGATVVVALDMVNMGILDIGYLILDIGWLVWCWEVQIQRTAGINK